MCEVRSTKYIQRTHTCHVLKHTYPRVINGENYELRPLHGGLCHRGQRRHRPVGLNLHAVQHTCGGEARKRAAQQEKTL